ncbi:MULTISPECIES: EcsC family protein [Luteococcus]|uniref:2,4-dihydroxyhept-2-ene-1,7-dioic acid aldolase n=1 Tax=Luteococcus japonicus LSP_Lj1 TaxID=1255658 RepID=A0A1R4KB05_9ACTN|nr:MULTISPECIES: EcsC family protein [Luteococcus]MDN5563965.1 EcsC family protein [Luteococcus sp.]SJN41500.1 2,4-dihydroxyhept-2-ene-1,7-dioic acid aldolase [Luteococcus japonicus LSP_Lj1]
MATAKDIGKTILAQAPNIAPGAASTALRKALDLAIDGVGKVPGAKQTAANALQRTGSAELAVNQIVKQHVAMAGAQGFITNLGGLATLAVSIPANVSGVAIVQCRMVAAVAHLRGYDIEDPRVRSAILMCLLGEGNAREAVQRQELPSSALAIATAPVHDPQLDNTISEKVLANLMGQVGGKRVSLLAGKKIPVVGGGVGAATDGWATWSTGAFAKAQFINRRR